MNKDGEMSNDVQWYPCPQIDTPEGEATCVKSTIAAESMESIEHSHHPIWQSGKLKYTSANKWQSISNERRILACRDRIHGVEVRTLPENHFLRGEEGLFATVKFSKFDLVGEYTGKIVGQNTFGHYVASLEDKDQNESLGIDAATCGNELRFINSHLNIRPNPNVSMRTAYVNNYPHIVIVCIQDIEVGEEFLLDYGEGYNNAYLVPKPKSICTDTVTMMSELRQMNDDNSDDDVQTNL